MEAMANPLGGGNGMVLYCTSPPKRYMILRKLTRAADSDVTLDAQSRYAEVAKDIIRRYFAGEEQDPVSLIVIDDVSFS